MKGYHNRDANQAFSLRMCQRSTATEINSLASAVHYMGTRLDLGAYVRAITDTAFKARDTRNDDALHAFSDLNEQVRNRSGQAAIGTWLPLSALTRRIDTSATGLTAPRPPEGVTLSFGSLSQVVDAGATVLSGLNGSEVGLPYLDATSPVDGWHDEDTAAATDEPSFGTATLVPKSLTFDVVMSRRMVLSSKIDLHALIQAELFSRVGRAIDSAAVTGDGNVAPLGVLNRNDLQLHSLGADGGAISLADLAALEYAVNHPAQSSSALTWIASPKLIRKLRLTTRSDGRALLEDGHMLGYPVRTSANMPDDLTKGASGSCSSLILGDFSEIVLGFWGPAAIDLFVDPVTMGAQGKVRLIARAEIGIVARRIGAFAAIKDAITTV